MWKVREASGSLGFATSSSLLREANSGYRESIIPIDDVDASVTNDAVESLKVGRQHLYDCLQAIYVKDTGIRGVARSLGKAESTIKAQLCAADQALAIWFSDRKAKQQKSFTT